MIDVAVVELVFSSRSLYLGVNEHTAINHEQHYNAITIGQNEFLASTICVSG